MLVGIRYCCLLNSKRWQESVDVLEIFEPRKPTPIDCKSYENLPAGSLSRITSTTVTDVSWKLTGFVLPWRAIMSYNSYLRSNASRVSWTFHVRFISQCLIFRIVVRSC